MTTLALFPASRQTPSSSAHDWRRVARSPPPLITTTRPLHKSPLPFASRQNSSPPPPPPKTTSCACMHSNPRATCPLRSPVPRAVTGELIESAVHQLPPPPPAGRPARHQNPRAERSVAQAGTSAPVCSGFTRPSGPVCLPLAARAWRSSLVRVLR
ncbi:hypothetical protein BKA81DRAFT_369861 [Phyllosticta paracitricarpa]|uniref:Uncharacterized protein n=1 Tax=Phyllosticta paracitricarpa TaxID=2016321 RepID=A0ABR1NHA9_9PEZI